MNMSWDITIMIDSKVNITKWLFSQFLILVWSLIFLVIKLSAAYDYHNEIAFRVYLTYLSKIPFL